MSSRRAQTLSKARWATAPHRPARRFSALLLCVTIGWAVFCPITRSLADSTERPRAIRVVAGARPILSAPANAPSAPVSNSTAVARPATNQGPRLAPTAHKVSNSTAATRLAPAVAWSGEPVALQTATPSEPVLRWRTRSAREHSVASSTSAGPATIVWQDRNVDHGTGKIRTVTHQQQPNPFSDPFGDRSTPASPNGGNQTGDPPSSVIKSFDSNTDPAPPKLFSQPPMESSPAKTDPLSAPLPVPTETDDPPPAPPLSDIERLLPRMPTDDSTFPPGKKPAPSFGPSAAGRRGSDTSCKRVYEGRNCCDEEEKCRTALQALRDNPITKISLDITATFKPDAETKAEELEKREDRIRQMPARIWRDRASQVIVEGRLVDIRFRQIFIKDAEGKEVKVSLGNLSDDDICFLTAWWEVPTECSLGDEQFAARNWQPSTMTWKASSLCHKPLYFEEVQLERYGHTTGPLFQPVISGAHFFLNIAALPYKMGINPPLECRYALGYYRPGSCAPWLLPPVPLSLRGGLLQAGAVVGIVALFP